MARLIRAANSTIEGITMISEQLDHSEHDSIVENYQEVDPTSNILTQATFSLLEERLRVELIQRKVGELVIRKEIETQLVSVQVPVRREKLIIEQVSPAYKLLAEIDLSQPIDSLTAIVDSISGRVMSASSDAASSPVGIDPQPENLERRTTPTVYGSTDSLRAASELLHALASLPSHDCGSVRIEIALKDARHQANYQALVDRYCQA